MIHGRCALGRERNESLGYEWPKHMDTEFLEELLSLDFLEQADNVILVGPNGVGKTMIAKNLLHQGDLVRLPPALRRCLRHDARSGRRG
jgi:MoxR-like ATPase